MNALKTGLVAFSALSVSAFAQFTAGDLAVVRVGDGSGALSALNGAVAIQEYTTLGGLANTYNEPTSGGSAFVMTGNATAEGALSRSADGSQLTFAGYNLAFPIASSPAAATAAAAPRAIGTISASGAFGMPVVSSTAFSGNGFRSAVEDNANNYWGIANGGGLFYFGNTASSATIAANPANNRVMNIVNNNLYWSTGSGQVGVYAVSGMPTAAATTNAVIITAGTGTGTASPYDFAFNAGQTLAYVCDDRTTANGGGVQRWDLISGVWTLSYTLNTGGTGGARGLAVDFSGVNPVLYATTVEGNNNRLVTITDTGAGSVEADLATAGVNRAFRGLEFAPVAVPEPASAALIGLGFAAAFAYRRRKN